MMDFKEYKNRYCAKLCEQAGITFTLAEECFNGYAQPDLDEMLEEGDPEGSALEELSYWDD